MKIILLTLLSGLLGYTISKPLDLNDDNEASVEHRSEDLELPYYGGLQGQSVHIKDGKIYKVAANGREKENTLDTPRQGPVAASSSNIALMANDRNNDLQSTFEEDFNKIQLAAARLVAIQEMAKRKGNFSSEDNRVYAESLLVLGQAAQHLAMLHQTGQIQDLSVLLQPFQNAEFPEKPSHKGNKTVKDVVSVATATDENKVDEVTEQHFGEVDLLPQNPEDPYEDIDDSVAIVPPKKDASVAEARPVSFSIAGEGGVASAKPNAVALTGRNGLAVSAPKATAIAGVTAEEAAAFSISVPSRNNLIIKSAPMSFSPPSFNNYDDIDVSPLQANTYNNFLMRSDNTMRNRTNGKPKPMMGTINAVDAVLKMWRTAIADAQAAPNDALGEPVNDFDIEQFYKISKLMNQRRRT